MANTCCDGWNGGRDMIFHALLESVAVTSHHLGGASDIIYVFKKKKGIEKLVHVRKVNESRDDLFSI